VRSDRVVVLSVAFSQGLPGLMNRGLCPNLRQPGADDLRGHLSTVVGSDVLGHAPHEHDVGHRLKHAEAVDTARRP
jgi:hypothetical protein